MKLSRVKLENRQSKISMIMHGYGALLGKYRFGVIEEIKNRKLVLSCKDSYGVYHESYSLKTGRRLNDLYSEDGWQIDLKDINDTVYKPVTDPDKNTVIKLHEEEIKLNSNESIIYQIWKHKKLSGKESLYLKSFRKLLKVKDGENGIYSKVTKEYPCVVSIQKVIDLIGQFVEVNINE